MRLPNGADSSLQMGSIAASSVKDAREVRVEFQVTYPAKQSKEHRWVGALAVALLLMCVAGIATAQGTQPWNENRLTWDAPTTCQGGQPVTNCAVTSYQIQRAPVSNGPYTPIGTSNTTTFTHVGAAAGVNCYVVVAQSANGPSRASAHVCKTNVEPAGPPNPPTNLRFVTEVVAGIPYAPVFTVLASGERSATIAGFASVGVPCEGGVLFTYRGKGYMRPTVWRPWHTSAAARVAVACA